MLINSPVFVVLLWYLRKISDMNERLSRLEGSIDAYFGIKGKGKK